MRRILYCSFLVLASLAASCARAPQEMALSGPTMGTLYSIKVIDPPPSLTGEQLRQTVDGVLRAVDQQMSSYRADSEVSQFSASHSLEWISVSADLAALVDLSLRVSEQSNGAFDVTVAPLVSAWGFGPKGVAQPPEETQLAALAAGVGYRKLHARLAPPALRKDVPALTIDLNAIAPGFAVDRLAARFEALSVRNYLIEIGGEVRARGRNRRGEPWRVAVERPEQRQTPYAIVQFTEAAVATSGEYRHSYVHEGKRYSHTIDPRTARPIEHTASVVVIDASAAQADAWATAFNVLGPTAGYELAAQLQMPVMFIEQHGETLVPRATPQFEPYVAWRAGAARSASGTVE